MIAVTSRPGRLNRLVLAVTCVVLLPTFSQAQQLPGGMSSEEALRRLQQSGLTTAEIGARLEAAGYPSNMLEAFLARRSASDTVLTPDLLSALAILEAQPVETRPVEAARVRDSATSARVRATGAAGEVQLFGLDVFAQQTTQFQPLASGPVPETYRLGAGDVMVLVLTGDVEQVHQLSVTREGFVVIPRVGTVFVNNLTMGDLQTVLRDRLARSYSGVRQGSTRFDVTVARLRTIQVFVFGEVVHPGAYQLSSVGTILSALYAAGGPSGRGNFRAVRVERAGTLVSEFDLYQYLLAGSAEKDIGLQNGDVVFVPVHGPRVTVSGAVTRPAIYEVQPNEALPELVRMAGGFSSNADRRRIAVHRIVPLARREPGPVPRAVVDVPLSVDGNGGDPAAPAREPGVPALRLENGDSVVVDSVPPLANSAHVTIGGTVHKPGRYAWSEGMTVRDLVRLARGPLVGADLRQAEVARLPNDRSQGSLATTVRVPLDSTYLTERDSAGRYVGAAGLPFPAAGASPEFPLRPFDQVTIFRQPQFEFQRSVAITGEVAFPGPYALERKDERLVSLVRRAGGLLPSGYSAGAQFFRTLDGSGRVNVSLSEALDRPDSDEDIVLQPGDSIHVPEYVPLVRVVGAVNSPVTVRYEDGRGLDYYIENAGGYSGNADKGKVSVRYSDGSARVKSKFLFFSNYPSPGPGSTVYVPPTLREKRGIDPAVLFGGIAQVLSAITTIVLVVQRI